MNMLLAATVYFMVLTDYKYGTTVIPIPYLSKEACYDAGAEMRADYDDSESGSGITRMRFLCVRNTR